MKDYFQSGSSSPFTLMYKRYTSAVVAKRFGIGGNFHRSEDVRNFSNTSPYGDHSSAIINLIVGKEAQRTITKSWYWYYGGDLMPSYSFNRSQTYQGDSITNRIRNKSYGLTARPFLGLRFNIHSKLYLSAEASMNLSYSRSEQSARYYPDSQQGNNRAVKNTSWALNFVPANGIFIYYRF